MTNRSVKIVEKPWGHEEIWAKTDNYVAKMLYIKKGHRLSLQYHVKKEETIRVLSGEMVLHHRLELDDMYGAGPMSKSVMKEGDCFHVKPGTHHRFEAENTDVVLLEVSTTEIDDVVRLQDDYNRGEK